MRTPIIFVCALMILIGDIAHAGEKKEPSPTPGPRGFDAKKVLHRNPSPDQRSLFEADIINLAGRMAAARQTQTDPIRRLAATQALALQSLRASSKGHATIVWDDAHLLPVFMEGLENDQTDLGVNGSVSEAQASRTASGFLQANAALLRIQDPVSEFVQTELSRDELGFTHVRYQQMYQGVEVWGRDIRVHVSRQGQVESFNGRYIPTPTDPVPGVIGVDAEQAQSIALERSGATSVLTGARRVYLPGEDDRLSLCWLVEVMGGLDQRKDMFIETSTGRVKKEYNRVVTDGPVVGSGIDVKGVSRPLNVYQLGSQYYMIDVTKPMFNASQSQMPDKAKGAIYAFDARNGENNIDFITSTSLTSWTVAPGVSAVYTGGMVYDYFKSVHGRNAIDNQGGTMNFVVNFKVNYNNAFWNGQYMVFGNGDGVTFSDLSGAADVTAHEMTHGITEWTAGLLYENQSGALNESFSDVFGTLFEFWLVGAAGDWLMGEDVFTPGTPGDALRSMSDPGGPEVPASSRQPSRMIDYVNLPNTEAGDHGGVHINSGIPNKAFYLFATATGMTKEDAGKVYYRALTTYLTKNAQFVDCRLAVIKAAEDLFGGTGNAKALAAAAAFDAVGITSGTGTGDPPVDPPVQGTPYLALINAVDGKLYRWTIGTSTFTQLSSTALASRPAATDNGAYVFYVDQTSNLQVVQSDGTNQQALSTSGGFNNIAISRSGRYLAATTVFSEPKIYVFDLQNSQGNKVLQLYTPTYNQGESAGSIRFPDRIDWTSDETKIMYDAYNTTILAQGDTLGFWDINTVRVADGSIARLFPAQPRGTDIGNAVFASNTDNLIAFDKMDENGQVQVLAVNLNSGNAGVVTNNYSSLGSPSFSVDDRKVYYHYIDGASQTHQIWSVDLQTDGITGSGADKVEVNGAVYPLAFAIGTRSTEVPSSEDLPHTYALEQNFPNPFNPSTTIYVDLPHASRASLIVYDILGREVARLMDEQKEAGRYALRFDGKGMASGVYLYRLQAGGMQMTRRMLLMK